MIYDLGWFLGLFFFVSIGVFLGFKEKIGVLYREMVNVKFDGFFCFLSDREIEEIDDSDKEEEEI